ncbi:MAG TPA: hypothetical protein VG603_05390 [Chitinophagales bacterium]|nr:hypothetical protein [Chitinophagales bacterium]
MAAQEARDYYYDKGRSDYMSGRYDQPFPNPMLLELDEFEMLCNKAYNKGYNDEREGKNYDSPAIYE